MQAGARRAEIDVTVQLECSTLRPREGDLATAVIRLSNGTSRPAVLRDLAPAGDSRGGAVMTWQFAQPGLLRYVPELDEWIYDRRRAADKRRPVFNSGLLLPAETIVIRTRIRLLGLPLDLALTYFHLSRADVTQMVYFEERADREVRYKRMAGEELDRRLTPQPREDMPGHRVVIFPYAEQVIPTVKRKTVRVDATVEPRRFGLAAALRKAGLASADEHTYAAGLDGWVLRRGDSFWLVSPDAVTPMPRMRQMERIFHYLDAAGTGKIEIEFLHETKTLFADKYRLVTDSHQKSCPFSATCATPDSPSTWR